VSGGLSIKGLSAGYGPIRVLENLDLEAPAGEITVVVGPNGAGKTTLLKAVSGLIPREGEVVFDGAALPVQPAAIVSRGLAQVAEGRQLFPQMSVLENLELGGYLLPRGERETRLQRIFGFFPKLAERRTQLAGTLSGGERTTACGYRPAVDSCARVAACDKSDDGIEGLQSARSGGRA
jgi:branched-chain amino acid transport system ATP-binding protein